MTWRPTNHDIARWRLRTQALTEPHAINADAVVGRLLAVQAENPAQSAWAVACRTSTPDGADLENLLAEGRIVRTHVLRTTWHYARAGDIGWLLELTEPRVRPTIRQGLGKAHGLDDTALDVLSGLVLDLLAASPGRTRDEVGAALAAEGRALDGHALMLLLADLELQRLVVSGRPRDGAHTYARFEDRVRDPRRPTREEALAELVLRYVTGHGPATVADIAYWATLTLGDVRRGLAEVQHRLTSFEHDGRTFWHAADQEPPSRVSAPAAHLLQILDEVYRGYQDSRMVLNSAGIVPPGRETSLGMALVDAQMVATIKRSVTPRQVRFDLTPYPGRTLRAGELRALQGAATRCGSFLGLEAELVVARP